MRSYVLTRNDMEQLVQDTVRAYRTGSIDTASVHRASRARTFRRAILRNYMENIDPVVIISDGEVKLNW